MWIKFAERKYIKIDTSINFQVDDHYDLSEG